MAIKSKIAKAVTPDLKTIKDVFGLNYGGITFQGLRVAPSGVVSCSRTFCSCGYSAAKIPPDADYNQGGHCPECGKPMLNLETGWGNAKAYNTKKRSASITTVKGNIMTINHVCFELKPNIPASVKAPNDADYSNGAYMEVLKLETTVTQQATLEKKTDGTIKFKLLDDVSVLYVPKTDETTEFLGWMAELFMSSRYMGPDVYSIDFDVLDAIQHFPIVFSKETYDRSCDAWEEAISLYEDSKGINYKGNPIPKTATIEKFFEAKGYPMALMSLKFEGRDSVNSSPEELQRFLTTSIGKIISARIANGQEICAGVLDSLVDIALVINGEKRKNDYYGYASLFEPFMKEAIDHYGLSDGDNLVNEFVHRIKVLRQQGIMPTEDTIRTRFFRSTVNSQKFQLKKNVDVVQIISDNPIEALKCLQVRKDD